MKIESIAAARMSSDRMAPWIHSAGITLMAAAKKPFNVDCSDSSNSDQIGLRDRNID